jgi:IS30 family transposase
MSGAESLCTQERETISRELSRGRSARCIGKQLGRHHSTIANEINRNGGAANYRAVAAQERYESLKVRPKEWKLVASSRLHDTVNEGLEQKWSPEQISARLDEEYPDDPEMTCPPRRFTKHCICRRKASCAPNLNSRYDRVGRGEYPDPGRL